MQHLNFRYYFFFARPLTYAIQNQREYLDIKSLAIQNKRQGGKSHFENDLFNDN